MSSAPRAIVFALFLLSGCAGLIYEVVWTRELIFVFGGTTYAITTILVAFMSGLGLGSYLGGRLCHRLRQPGRVYGLLEIGIGAYALMVPVLFAVAEPAYRAMYPHLTQMPWLLTGVRFCIGFLVLLLPTTCMGATLPILVHHITSLGQGSGRSVGLLYGINTFGAMLGTVAAGFWLIPAAGLTMTTRLSASLNVLVGLTAILLLRMPSVAPAPKRAPKSKHQAEAEPLTIPSNVRRAVLIGFAISGFAAMVYQIAWTRALIMSLGSSTYSFTCILAAFILGLAVGSLAIARWVDRLRQPVLIFGVLEIAIGLSAVLIVPIHGQVPAIVRSFVEQYHATYSVLLASEFLLLIAVTFIPTFLMGAIFPLVTRLLAGANENAGAATGRAYAVNTLGTIAGSFLAGFIMIRSDVLGVQNSIVAAALLNALVGAWLVIVSRPAGTAFARRALVPAGAVLLVPVVAVIAGRWDRNLLLSTPFLAEDRAAARKPEDRILYYGEGIDLTVAVRQLVAEPNSISLSVNGKTDASTNVADMGTQLMLGHVPTLLVHNAKKACIIGLGSGMTLSAIARYPSYEQLDCVEISDEVIRAASCFAPYNYRILTDDPRVHMIRADGRNHLLLTDQTYDVIVSEPSNPWMSGVSNLFTREYFELCKQRLSEHGRVCIWLHSYSMSLDDFRMVVRTLFDVFDFVSIWDVSSDYLLIAGREADPLPLDSVLDRFNVPAVREDLYRIGVAEPGQILGRFITSGPALREWAASAPVHTDDNALLEFSAPRNIYRHDDTLIAANLAERQRSPFGTVILVSPGNEQQQQVQKRTEAVVAARAETVRAWDLGNHGDIVGSLTHFIAAYHLNPRNVELYQVLRSRQPILEQRSPRTAAEPKIRTLFAQIARLRAPTITPNTGTTLAGIAQQLKTLAAAASQRRELPVAIDFLSEAADCEPDDEGLLTQLCDLLCKDGRRSEAIQRADAFLQRHPQDGRVSYLRAQMAAQSNDIETTLSRLDAALKTKVVTPSEAMEDGAFGTLRDDPRFKALLNRHAQTQPASHPS